MQAFPVWQCDIFTFENDRKNPLSKLSKTLQGLDYSQKTKHQGIVADSDPAAEQRECEAKAGALFAAAREAYRVVGGQA